MPMYTFTCPACEESSVRITKSTIKHLPCDCGSTMDRELPKNLNSSTLEMRDKHRGVQLPKNHEANMKKRLRDHHRKYETAEKIDKHGIDDAKRLGWGKEDK